jgi:hypothetical protein
MFGVRVSETTLYDELLEKQKLTWRVLQLDSKLLPSYCTVPAIPQPGRTSSIFFAVLLQLQFASYIPSLARVAMEEPPVRECFPADSISSQVP